MLELGWTLGDVFVFYWAETALVTAECLLKLLFITRSAIAGKPKKDEPTPSVTFFFLIKYKIKIAIMIAVIPLFFWGLHAMVIYSELLPDTPVGTGPIKSAQKLIDYFFLSEYMMPAMIASASWRFLLFIVEFLFGGLYKKEEGATEVVLPYARLIILHVSSLIIAFLYVVTGINAIGLTAAFTIFKSLAEAGLNNAGKGDSPNA